MLVGTKGIKVLAPTWFTLVSDEGEVNCKASSDYVKKAHKQGMQVWGVLDNFQNDENIVCTAFLETLERRSGVIDEVVSKAKEYKLDGINVDIEGLGETHGEDFVEFVREISIACRRAGLIISINNYVPYNFNDYYDLMDIVGEGYFGKVHKCQNKNTIYKKRIIII